MFWFIVVFLQVSEVQVPGGVACFGFDAAGAGAAAPGVGERN